MTKPRTLIGLSSCMFHPEPDRAIFKGKRLLYLEESMAHYVARHGAVAGLIPTSHGSDLKLSEVLDSFDGLLLTGGVDLAPETYGESPLHPDWAGDRERDLYELELTRRALELGMPILGICRGAQLLNAACGGTLYQDITTQVNGSLVHRNWDIYDQNFHKMTIEPNSGLSKLYPGKTEVIINSIHHQGIKDVAPTLMPEAFSSADGIVEAIRKREDSPYPGYVFAVQWHPEFQNENDEDLLDPNPIMQEFMTAAKEFAARSK